MTQLHLDSSFLIGALKEGTSEDLLLTEWVKALVEIKMSVVAFAEVLCGPIRLDDRNVSSMLIDVPLSLVEADAFLGAELYNLGGRRRRSFADCLIAAVAIRAKAPLATSNVADFERFEKLGLQIIAPSRRPPVVS